MKVTRSVTAAPASACEICRAELLARNQLRIQLPAIECPLNPRGQLCRFSCYTRGINGQDFLVLHQNFAVHNDTANVLLVGNINEVRYHIVGGYEVDVIERHLDDVGALADLK